MVEVTYEGGVFALRNNKDEYYWCGVKPSPESKFPTPNVVVPVALWVELRKAAIEAGIDSALFNRFVKEKKKTSTRSKSVEDDPNAISIF